MKDGKNEKKGFLGSVAAISNRLPHPVTIFIILSVVVGIASVIFSKMGVAVEIEAINRSTKQIELQTFNVKNLFDTEGIRWIFESAVKNFASFEPLGIVLFFSLFFNFLNEVGLFPAFLKKSMQKIKGKYISLFIAFLGVNSSFAGDIGYVLVILIAGIIYKQLKRNSIAGIILGFSSTSAGFAACLVSIDALIGGLSTSAVQIVNPDYVVTPLANSIFMFFFTFFITIIIAFVNDKFIEPKVAQYFPNNEISSIEEEFSEITELETKGLKAAGLGFLISFAIILLLSVPNGAPLRNPKTGLLLLGWSPLLSSIVAVICFIFFVPGIFYGVVTKKIKNDKDLMALLFKSLDGFGAFIVLCFFSSIFISWFSYTQLGVIIAAKGGTFLSNIGLTRLPLIIAFILFCSFANLFIGSMTSKYVLLAPIFLPMLYKMGISPELAQLAYRIGDSSTNVISPLMSYFALILMYCNKYNKKFGMGDLISYMIPHSIVILISSLIFLGIWVIMDLPIGFGTVNFL
ncbi:AbgT family transporter [Fusobacterium russii]|uniref:AbgT family transporter n=1 Tax=Fusobacterium russii TaxID=854 RepID=UPI00039EA63F|nr:AbgT family transporter [Fusobacterium russii]